MPLSKADSSTIPVAEPLETAFSSRTSDNKEIESIYCIEGGSALHFKNETAYKNIQFIKNKNSFYLKNLDNKLIKNIYTFFEAKNIKPISMPKFTLGAGAIFTVNLTADQKIDGVSRACLTVSKKLSTTFALTHLMATLALLRLNKLKKASASLSGYCVACMMSQAPKKVEEKAVKEEKVQTKSAESESLEAVSYKHLTLPTNREV